MSQVNKAIIEIMPDADSIAKRCLLLFVMKAQKTISEKGVFYFAVSGGDTPKRFFTLLGNESISLSLPWDKIHIFWVDERYVPLDSPLSNYRLAAETFLTKVKIPQENIHRIETSDSDIKRASETYQKTIQKVFALKKGQIPVFDLMTIGMGEDGHTASLFPHNEAVHNTDSLACSVHIPDKKPDRITLTPPVLRSAAQIIALIMGEKKAEILKKVFTAPIDEVQYPIQILWPVLDKVTWLIDNQAARLLQDK